MKKIILEKLLTPYLTWCARRIIQINQPIVVGVTGSVGKSSAKEAIYLVLKTKFSTRRNQGNLNNEIGLPLAVIGDINPKNDLIKWLQTIFRGFLLTLKKSRHYPEILVLEMAVDRPGDMKHLLSIAPCKVGVITSIGVSHLAFFQSEKDIFREKSRIFKNLPQDGLAIVNFDDPFLRGAKTKGKNKVFTFGFRTGADIQATEMKIGYAKEIGEGVSLAQGTSFRVNYNNIFLPVRLPLVISQAQVYSALAAMAVGLYFGMNLVEIATALKKFQSLPGRMRLLRGKKGNIIIDDTYNAAPNSVKMALSTLALIKTKKKTLILGDMLELGSIEEAAHRNLARIIHPVVSKIFLVGERTLNTHRELRRLGFAKDKIFHFKNSTNLAKKIGKIIGSGEVILVKGSQGARMEKIVEKLVVEKEKKKFD